MPQSLWRSPDFGRLWAAQTISVLGTQVTLLALPLVAITALGATPFQVGLLGAAEFVPFLLVGLPAGAWVDRLRRRPVMIAADAARAAALAAVPAAAALGALRLELLYAVALVTGTLTVFFDVAYSAYLPSIVTRERLLEGNSKLELSRSGATLAGPGLGGVLVQVLSAPVAILADAVSYAASALLLLAIRRPEDAPARDSGPRTGMLGQIVEGLRFVLAHPLLRPIALCTAITNLAFGAIQAVLLLHAVRSLHMTAGEIGLVLAVGNGGGLLGALASGHLGPRLGVGPTIIGSIATAGLSTVLFPLATPGTGVVLLAAGLFLGGLASMAYNVTQVSLRQAITPDRLQGRMSSSMRFVVWGIIPLGSLLGGLAGNAIGSHDVLWLAVPVSLAAVVPPLLSPVRTLRRPAGPGPETIPAESRGEHTSAG